MLKNLFVQNYALIDELNLSFGKGMNIITGETGAGKSVLMGALGLLLGERADSSSLLDTNRKCLIRGEFLTNPSVRNFLVESELDSDAELVIQREISKDGKSRAYVNETPVNLTLLRALGEMLVDVHSQHETLLLNKSDFQLSVLDAFSNNRPQLKELSEIFKTYAGLNSNLKKLQEEEEKSKSEQDFLKFQFTELNDAALIPEEVQKLEEELTSLSHAGEIVNVYSSVINKISGENFSLLSSLTDSINRLDSIGKYSSEAENVSKRLKEVRIEIKDIEYELNQLAGKTVENPGRLEMVNDRLNILNKLLQKHRLKSSNELIQLRESINEKISSFNSLGDEILQTKSKLEKSFLELKKCADIISSGRKKVIPQIETKIKKLLSELSMPEAVLKIELTDKGDEGINSSGRDQVNFLFSANKGIAYSDISKVASGGELSRLMLSLKACVAKLVELPTIVFDEIDTGVSGETAFRIGKVMQELSQAHQLIAITHLPQIASRGEDHFFVYKELNNRKTVTKVKKLKNDERIVEVARMLSGDKPSSVAMENAKELLKIG